MYMDEYRRWLAQNLEDPDLMPELHAIGNEDQQIRERFAIDLSFGTAGLRGIIGAGTNRMNIYTVRKATQGLAAYLLESSPSPSVAIAYDSRIKSDLFAKEAASVFAANGVTVYIYPVLEPVPALSFAVRKLGTSAGIMVTASHNPAKYNGYKVYGPDGCQLSTDASSVVLEKIEQLDIFKDVKSIPFEKAVEAGTIRYIDDSVLEAFYSIVESQSVRPGIAKNSGLKVVYSPLNGTGNIPVRRVLKDIGLTDITVVPQQEMPDGNFPTCSFPNPEVRESLALGLELAENIGADLMLATDPDTDRVGIAVPDDKGEYHLLSGNEVGVLLLQYICEGRIEMGTMPKNPLTVKSIVTTPLADVVAKHYTVELVNVLTGFKYIGEQILHLEQKNEKDRFILGFEESYGYLIGTHVRDKDAVVASMLICEMAAYYTSKGSSLYKALGALYNQFGYYHNAIDNFSFEGLAGMDKMAEIMAGLRTNPLSQVSGSKVVSVADYQNQTLTNLANSLVTKLALPSSNVLSYVLEDGSNIIVRPSGTEPKIKVYYTTTAKTASDAAAIKTNLAKAMTAIINS